MSVAVRTTRAAHPRERLSDRAGDWLIRGLCAAACLIALAAMVAIAYKLITGAHLAFSKFGPNFLQFGALPFIYGTAMTSGVALVLALPIGVAIGLYLSLLAPQRLRGVVGPLVEMLAAIPSVILGLWGILVLAPFIRDREPAVHGALGFVPLFGRPQTVGASVFTAALILTIMIIPIIASISRDLFLTVPDELQDGAVALGATKWEVVRGVILPTTAS